MNCRATLYSVLTLVGEWLSENRNFIRPSIPQRWINVFRALQKRREATLSRGAIAMNNFEVPIAIVGIAVEIPSGYSAEGNLSHDTFFDFLLNKKEAYEKFPSARFDVMSLQGPNLGQTITTTGCFLKDISLFDPMEFGITAKDVKAMALGTRKLIEISFLALLDSGIDYRARNVGCYMSAVAFDALTIAPTDVYEPRGSFAGYPYMVANKVSYHLDLLGPSVPVDTACSSTMTGLHLAVQALRSGDCESAVVGGCQLNERFLDFVQYSHGSVLAPDGKCKPFDISANGFSRGEGVGAIVLKPLRDAIRDGDYIYASVLGTGINSTGSAGPVSAPVAEAQIDAMRRAYAGTGRLPSEVDYVELHATGTAVGDPIEANWIGSEFKRDDELLVGSVKGNIGHLEIMSFLASVSKVCSIFRSGIIPPTANLDIPNPAIRWDEYRMRAPTESTPLSPRHPSRKALISMTSSGIGGSNGHAVLEGPPIHPMNCAYVPIGFPLLFIAGGLSPRSAADIGDALTDLMPHHDGHTLAAISNIYGRRSRQMSWRSAAVYVPKQTPIYFPPPRHSPRKKRPIVFVFSGQGPQHFQMGRQLYGNYAPFRASIERLDGMYIKATGTSLIQETGLFADNPAAQGLPEIWPISITLPALAMLQMALCDFFAVIGIVPDVVVGHSAGETAMLFASGAASQDTALRVAIARGRAMSLVEGAGSMAAMACNPSAAQDIINSVLKEHPYDILEIACYNARDSVTLAGTTTLIDQAIVLANDRGFFARKLRTNVPVHSSLMESCKQQYEEGLNKIFEGTTGQHYPRIRAYSSLTGRSWEEPFSAEYFWSNTHLPVLFSEAISSLLKDSPNASFIEIGPHPALGSYIESFDPSLTVIAPMKRSKSAEEFHEVQTFLSAVGNLIVDGCNVSNFAALIPQTLTGSKISTPPYPFARKPVPYRPDPSIEQTRLGPLNGPNLGLNSLTHPVLAQHVIRNEPIMPAAGYLEMAFEFGARYVWNVQFENIMPLFPDRVLRVQVSREGHFWSVRSWASVTEPSNATAMAASTLPSIISPSDICASLDLQGNQSRLHAHGYMTEAIPHRDFEDLKLDDIRNRCEDLEIGGFYARISYFAQYGKAYQRVTGCHVSNSEGLIRIQASEGDLTDVGEYHFNPVVLDSCLHALVHPVFTRNPDTSVYYLPSSVQTVMLHKSFSEQQLPSTLYAYAKLTKWDPEFITWDLTITNAYGSRICTLTGLCVSRHPITPPTRSERCFKHIYQVKSNQERDKLSMQYSPSYTQLKNPVERENGTSSAYLSIFHQILETIIQVDRKQVVRIMIISFDPSTLEVDFRPNPAPKSALLDYTFATVTNEQSGPVMSPEHVRQIQFHPDSSLADQGLRHCTFDIIIIRDISSSHSKNPSGFMENMHRLLQPGGYLVMGPVVGDAALPTSAIDGLEPSTTFWGRRALCADFSRLELHSDQHEYDHSSFILEAQKASWPALPWNSANLDVPYVIHFVLEQVLQHQEIIRAHESGNKPSLWIAATSDIDDAAALGFSRSLRREMHSTMVYLVLFDPIWTPETRVSIIGDLATNPDVEVETLIDKYGHAYVPRLVSCISRSVAPPLDLEQYWQLKSGLILAETAPAVSDGYVLVQATHLSVAHGGLKAFVGRIASSGSALWSTDDPVVGVVDSDRISNYFLVHEGQVVAAADKASRHLHAACAVALVLLTIALGVQSIRTPRRLRGRKFLVTNADEPLGQWFSMILISLGVTLETCSERPTEIPLEIIHNSHFILSGYSAQEDIQVIQSAMNANALAVWWGRSTASREILRNPWIVGDALDIFKLLNIRPPVDLEVVFPSPEQHLVLRPRSHMKVSVFDPKKSYLLIGGIGSLGLSIAWWMYQKGARQIILTSRSGESSLTRDKNTPAIRLLTYLRSIADLSLRLEACDAASWIATAALVNSASPPLAGCMLLAVVFSDRGFLSHTEDSFYIPFAAKQGAIRALEKALKISSLDFLITLSSVTGLFGSPGQTNYAGANTSVDALTQAYPNAFSIIAPAIVDSNFLTDLKSLSSDPRFRMWTAWGITSRQLCDCIEDGVRSLNQGTSCGMYLPDVNWEEVRHQLGTSPMYDHFLEGAEASRETLPQLSKSSLRDALREIAVKILEVDIDEFSPDIPFTSYGLDSLSAGRLSFMLKPYLSITQVQLLAEMSLADVYQRIELPELTTSSPAREVNSGHFSWETLNQSGQTVVPLVEGEGIPLIVIHGSSGNILAFNPLQERFKSPLWALQTTPETPFGSLEELGLFYFQEIKAKRPVGPYRLAGFSGNTLLAFHIALHFERNGDHVVQLVMLDHFPTLFTLPSFCHLDDETLRTNIPSRALLWQSMDTMFDLYKRDPSPSRLMIPEQLTNAFNGLPASDSIRAYYEVHCKTFTMIVRFMLTGLGTDDESELRIRLERWLHQVKAPVTTVVAKAGFHSSLSMSGWDDLGCRQCFPDAKIVFMESGHFSMFEMDALIEELEHGW